MALFHGVKRSQAKMLTRPEQGQFIGHSALHQEEGFWLERQNPFDFYFLNWLRGADLN